MSDSKRLLSPGEGDALERALLESAEIPEPTASSREAIWASLAARITAAAPSAHGVDGGLGGPDATALAGKAGFSVVAKLALISVTCIAVGSAAVAGRGTHRDGPSGDRAVLESGRTAGQDPALAFAGPGVGKSLDEPANATGVAAMPVASPSATVAPSVVAPPPATAAASGERPSNTARAASSAPPPSVDPTAHAERAARPNDAPNEATLLLAARSSLRAGSCAGALAKLDDMAVRFPRGAFTQEREVMTLEALDCSGRGAEVTERAARFLRDHPASPYADAVRSRR